MYEYKPLTRVSFEEISKCFNLAFSDYLIKMELTSSEIEHHFKATAVDKELSFGAFYNGELIGFIFNSHSVYQNQEAVFDVGTGVVPAHRGNKVFSELFDYCEKELKKKNIKKYYLEVLHNNEKAISAYSKKGFKIEREFLVLKGPDSIKDHDSFEPIKEVDYENFHFLDSRKCICVPPSYEHNTNILNLNKEAYKVIYLEENNSVSAFCIYLKDNGSIVQFGYFHENALKLLMQHLITRYKSFIVKNIDTKYTTVIEAFNSLGFIKVAEQFEMSKDM